METPSSGKELAMATPEDATLPSLPTPVPFTSTNRLTRLRRRLRSVPLISRSTRILRKILGPNAPIPDVELPLPEASFTLSFTFSSSSRILALDSYISRISTKSKLAWALYPYLAIWITIFILLIRQQYYISGPLIISCDASLWSDWPPDTCGLNGTDCWTSLVSGTYRCMGGCKDVTLGNPRWVGGEVINGVPLVIGGGDDSPYRADSWVCPAAIQSGLISPTLGGSVSLIPSLPFTTYTGFIGTDDHGIRSVGFQPSFPGSFALYPASSPGDIDLHPIISGVNAFLLLLLVLFLRPPTAVLFTILTILGWLQITLLSDPAYQPPDWGYIFGGLPAVLFTSYWIYRVSFQRTMTAFQSLPVDMAVWQGAGYWIGIESYTIFAKLPIQRLGYGALSADGVIALISIIIVAAIVVLIQAWQMRKYGLLQYYLIRYLPLIPILITLAFIPSFTLRLHHYLYSLAAIPVLSLPNRVSLFGQAFAFGLFLDGVGRWGWDSIIDQTSSLVGDAILGTILPVFQRNSTAEMISWMPLPSNDTNLGLDAVALLVDDILRATVNTTTASSYPIANLSLTTGIDHFFRLAYIANGSSLDYTNPIVLHPNGSYTQLY